MNNDVSHPVLKATIGFTAALGMDFLTTAGKVCGALTAIAIFAEWLWKKIVRPYLIRSGRMKGPPIDYLPSTSNDATL